MRHNKADLVNLHRVGQLEGYHSRHICTRTFESPESGEYPIISMLTEPVSILFTRRCAACDGMGQGDPKACE